MNATGKSIRLKRVWRHERAVIIPFDHGAHSGAVSGLENVVRLAERIAGTDADAILVTPGVLKKIAPVAGSFGIIVRMDGGFTKFAPAVTDYDNFQSIEDVVGAGADAGIVFTFVGTSVEKESIVRLGRLAAASGRWGLPIVSEVLPPGLLANHFGSDLFASGATDREIQQQTMDVCRIAAEAGADVIKTRYSGSVEGFRSVIRSCGVPVIVAGGPALTTQGRKGVAEGILQLASDSMRAGAAGVIFGRNVWQHPAMEKMIGALCAIVHEGSSVASALKRLR